MSRRKKKEVEEVLSGFNFNFDLTLVCVIITSFITTLRYSHDSLIVLMISYLSILSDE
jgi:hypothetical protein